MTNEQVVAVICRLFGIYVSLSALLWIVNAVSLMRGPLAAGHWIMLGALFFMLVLSGVLIFSPLNLARLLLKGQQPSKQPSSWDLYEFQSVLCSVLGLYILVTTLTNLHIWGRVLNAATSLTSPQQSYQIVLSTLGTFLLQLVAGVWLLLGAKGLKGFLRYLRRLGSN